MQKVAKKKRARKYADAGLGSARAPAQSPATVAVGKGQDEAPQQKGPPGMSEDELQYRMMLQEAILWATQQLMTEQRDEILARAKARVKTLQELRG